MTARWLLPYRDQKIYREFNGRNVRGLAQRHGLSARQIRRIIDKQRGAQESSIATARRRGDG